MPGLVIALVTATGCAHEPDHFAQAEHYLRAGDTHQGRGALGKAVSDQCRRTPDPACDAAYLRAGDIASRAGDVQGAIPYFMSAIFHGQAQARERLAVENAKILAQQGAMESTIVVHKVNDVGPQLQPTNDLVWLDGKPITSGTIASGPHWIAGWFEFKSTSPVVGPFTYKVFSVQFFRTAAGPTTITLRTYLDAAKSGPNQLSLEFQIVPPPAPDGQPREAAATGR